MRAKHAILAGASCLAILSVSGCVAAAVGAVGAGAVATFQERTVGQAIDDATASNEIKAKLLSRGGYGEVDVEVANGLVLLTGRVVSPEMRVTAERIAWSSNRADDVANQIQIEAPGGFRANASDAWITTRVRSSLVTSRKVRGINFNIETYNGVVYLMGLARSQEELEAAARRASYVRGVQQVVSYMTVRAPTQMALENTAPLAQAEAAYPAAPGEPYYGPGGEQDLLGASY